jgi:crotonobetainyl-CoA:carnitine CoA-transferase CaiB-like acyl-CoA transferase
MDSTAVDGGPRRWWAGPLDVEGLALGAVRAAAAALDLYTGAPGRFTTTPALTAAAFDSSGHLRIAGRRLQGFAPLSGFRRTADGWVRLHANYPHHEQRLLTALGARTLEDVDAALLSMASLEVEELIQAHNGIAASVRTRGEWLASGMGRTAGDGPWITLTPVGGEATGIGLPDQGGEDGDGERLGLAGVGLPGLRLAGAALPGSEPLPASRSGGDPVRPLTGVRVLDLTRVIAGPVATRLLAVLGADVLRIDPPGLPELSDQFVDTCFDKRSAVADLGTPASQDGLRELLRTADVVVTGYRRGALDRFGLGADDLLADRPDLVVVTLNSWGTAGPWNGLRGFDSIVQAAAGIAHLYGTTKVNNRTDGDAWRPGALPVQALDHATGYGAAAAAVLLLASRRRTGRGGAARLSLARTAEELFSLQPNSQEPGPLPEPDYSTMPSSYGELRYVPPPLLAASRQLEYRTPPPPYGSSGLAWL